ncbi:hypothetical protein OG474_05555 [Kribbella sp. NBC_01505]|uniref:hypothetical protein n=1 Tax=Kribbella sp. NBC_01505 TaxID=2903580 RepID=UPI003870B56F
MSTPTVALVGTAALVDLTFDAETRRLVDIAGADPLIDLDAVRPFVALVNQAVEVNRYAFLAACATECVACRVSRTSAIGVVDAGSLFAELGSGWSRRPVDPVDREATR